MLKSESIGTYRVFCSDKHTFGTDAVLLAHFAAVQKAKTMCDMGTGCGIIALLALRDNEKLSCTAVDIQPPAIELVFKAVRENSLEKRLFPIRCDIREFAHLPSGTHGLQFGSFDLVTMNPPYRKRGAGLQTGDPEKDIARFELACDFDDCCAAAKRLLRPGGRFCVCHRPDRLTDVLCAMRKCGLEPKRLRQVQNSAGTQPMLILVEGISGANPGLRLLPALYLCDESGRETAELKAIYAPWQYPRGEKEKTQQ